MNWRYVVCHEQYVSDDYTEDLWSIREYYEGGPPHDGVQFPTGWTADSIPARAETREGLADELRRMLAAVESGEVLDFTQYPPRLVKA